MNKENILHFIFKPHHVQRLIRGVLGVIFLLICTTPSYALQGNSELMDPQVWKVEISGNETFSDIVLKQIIATEAPTMLEKLKFWKRGGHEVNMMEIRRDVIRIRRYYERRGFPYVNVKRNVIKGDKEWKRTVRFTVDENSPVIISDLTYQFKTSEESQQYITSSRAFRRAEVDHEFQQGMRYQTIKEPNIIGSFMEVLKNLGFAFAEVNIQSQVDSLQTSAEVTLQIDPGPRTYVSEVNVTGTETISDSYVIRETALHEGEMFTQNDLQQAQREIFNHHMFRFATIDLPDQPRDSTLQIDINVREYPLRSVQAQGGVGTEDLLRARVSWTHRNVLHSGHRLTASATVSFIEQSLNLNYLIPYVYNTKSSLVFDPFVQHILERQIYELFQGGITNSFIYQYRDDLTGTISYQFTRNMELSEQTDDALPDTTFEYDLSSFQLSGYYSPGFATRDQQGWVVQPYAEFSGLFGGAAFSFQKFSVDVRRYTNLTSSTKLATRLQLGGLVNVARDSLPQNIRYYLGGTSSVRGWGRNELGPKRVRFDSAGTFRGYAPVGGQAKFGFNLEIRQELNFFINGLGIAAFLDGGQVWRRLQNVGQRPIQFGVGGGLRYQSPIGPIRVDVGYKLNPTQEDLNKYQGTNYGSNFDRIGIHFSVGQAF